MSDRRGKKQEASALLGFYYQIKEDGEADIRGS